MRIVGKVTAAAPTMASDIRADGTAREGGAGPLVVTVGAVREDRLAEDARPGGARESLVAGTECPDEIDSIDLVLRIDGADAAEWSVGQQVELTVAKV